MAYSEQHRGILAKFTLTVTNGKSRGKRDSVEDAIMVMPRSSCDHLQIVSLLALVDHVVIMSAQIGRKSIEISLDENPSKFHWTKIRRNFIGRKSVEISLDENPSKSHWTKIHLDVPAK
jgi:ribosomal protein L24E